MADTLSKTLVESYAIQLRAFTVCAGMQDTIWKSRRAVQESRELMAEVDKKLNAG